MGDVIEVLTTATNTVEVAATGPQGAPGVGVPTGGSALQVLRKVSSTDYDTEWAAAGSGSGSVTSVALAGTGLSITGSPITTSGTITANVNYGTTAGTACEGNDSRIINIRSNSIITVAGGSFDNNGNPVEGIGGNGGTLNLDGGSRVEGQNGGNAGNVILQGGSGIDSAANGVGGNGGSIISIGAQGVSSGTGGTLNMSASSTNSGDYGFRGGNITTTGTATSAGGDINTSGGGSINTSGRGGGSIRLDGSDPVLPSGSIDTRGLSERGGNIETWGNSAAGGSINTSDGGGSINTRGTGSIGLGVSGTRTTLTGTATADRAISLPNASGTIALNETFAAPPAIGNTTPATGAFTTLAATPTSGSALTLTGGTVTASAPLIDATQTWNNGAVTFTGLAATITNTASATASLVARFTVGSTNVFEVDGRGFTKVRKVSTSTDFVSVFEVLRGTTSVVRLRDDGDISGSAFAVGTGGNVIINTSGVGIQSTARFGISSSAAASTTDCDLNRDAADTFAQRRTTNAQTFRIYNTFTSATNFERLNIIAQSAGSVILGTEKGSAGGTARALEFQTDGTTRGGFADSGAFYIGTSASFTSTGLQIQPTSNRGGLFFSNCSVDVSSSTVTIRGGSNSTDWIRVSSGLLLFQGTTTSFPALKRSSTVLQARLANDSDFCPLQGQIRIHQNAVAETITATHTLTLYDAAGTAYKVPCVAA